MKAIVLYNVGSPDILKIVEVPIPEVRKGWVLIKIKAFGLNRSEVMMRKFEGNAQYIKLPRIIGIECTGEIVEPSDSRFKKGQKIIALMGGMGRDFDGSYAEYALIPSKNVFTIDIELSWEEIAAIPETYFTAYGSLFESLQLVSSDKLFIRGGTSATGLAAIQIAKSIGTTVLASTRKKEKISFLKSCGVDYALIDDGTLENQLLTIYPNGVNKIIDLIGSNALLESLKLVSNQGIVCSTGILDKKGIINSFDPIKDIPNGVYLTSFYSNYPSQKKIDEIFNLIKTRNLHPLIAKIFPLEKIAEAHKLMESNEANGKIIIKL